MDFVAAHTGSPYVTAYPWTYGAGWGTKHTVPGSLPAAQGIGAAFTTAGDEVIVAHVGSPWVAAYPWSSGFGTKYDNPGTLPYGTAYTARFSSDGVDVAVASSTPSPFIAVYPFASDFGVKYSDPSTAPNGACYDIAFSFSGEDIAVAHATSPYVSVYPWESGVGFGAKYSAPGVTPGIDNGFGGICFSPVGDDIALATGGTPYLQIYPWETGVGFGVKYSNPTGVPGISYGVTFSPNGTEVVTAHNNIIKVSAFPFESGVGYGTKYSDPGTMPAGACYGVSFTPNGADIAAVNATSPYVTGYPWYEGSGFGTIYSAPGAPPDGTCTGGGFFPFTFSFGAYAWNPNNTNPSIALSNDDRTGLSIASGTTKTAISHWAKDSGKWYWEIEMVSIANASSFGICDVSKTTDFDWDKRVGWFETWALLPYNASTSRKYHDAANTSYAGKPTITGDRLRFAIDLDLGHFWMGKDEDWWLEDGDPALGTNPTFNDASLIGLKISAAMTLRYITNSATAHFALSQFEFAPPEGFAAPDGEQIIPIDEGIITMPSMFIVF